MPPTKSIASVRTTTDASDPALRPGAGWDRRLSSPMMPSNMDSLDSALRGPPGNIPEADAFSIRSGIEPRTTFRGAAMSPPPTPRSPIAKNEALMYRLRSNSGLNLHTNHSALRQYTEYGLDGSSRAGGGGTMWDGFDLRGGQGMGSIEESAMSPTRSSGMWPLTDNTPGAGLPDFLGRETLRMVLQDTTAAYRLRQFARSRGGAENLEFLEKACEYHRAVSSLTELMATISTTFTAAGATTPLRLPPQVSKTLNLDLKRVCNSVLPGLDGVFAETQAYVEQRVATTLFPEFVKHQLSTTLRGALASDRATTAAFSVDFPGLGDAFCLSDPYKNDHPLVCASDTFVRMTGSPRGDILGRNCRFLQGPMTDGSTVLRIKEAVARGEELTELILNYRRDGRPFWNFLFVCPLKVSNGKVRFYLGGIINVSATMAGTQDVVRLLASSLEAEDATASGRTSEKSSSKRSRRLDRHASIHSKEQVMPPAGKGEKQPKGDFTFFKPFRKSKDSAASPVDSVISPPPSRHGTGLSAGAITPTFLERRPSAQSISVSPTSMASPTHPAAPRDTLPPYGRLIVLQYVPASDSNPRSRPGSGGSGSNPRLKVTFCTLAALDALGLGPNAHEAVLYHDVFSLLGDIAGSPSVGRGFKAAVRDRVSAGEPTSIDLVVPSAAVGRSEEKRRGESGGGGGGGGGGAAIKGTKLMSHWCPMKDGGGQVAWVVLMLTPL